MREFVFLIDDVVEASALEQIALNLGATRINQEGWSTAYGGNGIVMFIESVIPRREWNMIVGGFDSVQLLRSKSLAA